MVELLPLPLLEGEAEPEAEGGALGEGCALAEGEGEACGEAEDVSVPGLPYLKSQTGTQVKRRQGTSGVRVGMEGVGWGEVEVLGQKDGVWLSDAEAEALGREDGVWLSDTEEEGVVECEREGEPLKEGDPEAVGVMEGLKRELSLAEWEPVKELEGERVLQLLGELEGHCEAEVV